MESVDEQIVNVIITPDQIKQKLHLLLEELQVVVYLIHCDQDIAKIFSSSKYLLSSSALTAVLVELRALSRSFKYVSRKPNK